MSASTDPTQSSTKRQRMRQKFRARWRKVRGAVRNEFRSGSEFRPLNNSAPSTQAADFREWFRGLLDEEVLEPITRTAHIERGAHYTGPWVREMYKHGIKLGEQELAKRDPDHEASDPAQVLKNDFKRGGGPGVHQEAMAALMVRTYHDLEDATNAVVREGSRNYRSSVETGESLSASVAGVNDRVDKVGRFRTDLVATSVGVMIINEAAVTQYAQEGVEEVGVTPERLTREQEQDPTTPPPEPPDPADDAEFVTAGDRFVCPQCASLAGRVFSVEDVQNGSAPLPVRDTHPGCRCFLTPR